MADVHDQATRSRNMAAIRGTHTKPEMVIRKGLHSRGLRFCLHDKRLAGTPDLVFPKFKAVIFVDGCFWHGHDCHLFKWPKTRETFWREKIGATLLRDRKNREDLLETGWRVGSVWECALKGRTRNEIEQTIDQLVCWLKGKDISVNIEGKLEETK